MPSPMGERVAVEAPQDVVAALDEIAQSTGRDLEAVFDEALRDYVERHRTDRPRRHVLEAFAESVHEFDDLYRALAK